MTNYESPSAVTERCATCPNRSKIARVLARLAGNDALAPDCEGPVTVSHGTIITQVRSGNEPAPDKPTWNIMSGARSNERRYSRTEWTTETVCGRNEITPHDGEVPYDPTNDQLIRVVDNKRYAAFITGDERDIMMHRAMMGIVALLDNLDTSTRQDQ